MISFLLCSGNDRLRDFILEYAKNAAAMQSNENWEYVVCCSEARLNKAVEEKACYDIACMDLSFQNSIDILKILRKNNPSVYIIVLSDRKTPAEDYVRPDIMTASAITDVTVWNDIKLSLKMNFTYYLKHFYGDNSENSFVLDNRDGRQLIPYNQICYFESCEKKIMLYTVKEQYSFYDTLDSIEKRLPDDFVRCHRSFIVRKDKIKKILLSQGYMVLEQGEMIPVSRTYRATVKELR